MPLASFSCRCARSGATIVRVREGAGAAALKAVPPALSEPS
jgi:hypothetical protein